MKIVNGILLACIANSLVAGVTLSQAWLPRRGQLSASLSYSYTAVGDHLFSADIPTSIGGDGDKSWDLGEIRGQSTILSLDYGLSERIAVSATTAYVASRYRGPDAESAELDNGSWNQGIQDLGLGIRWMAVRLPVTITPSMQVSLPSHDYNALGHAAIGRNLNELRLAANFGWVGRSVLPGMFVQANYGFVVSEALDDVRPNRSELGLELGYFVNQKLTMWGSTAYKYAHDGSDWYDELVAGPAPEDHFHAHDQLAKVKSTSLGGGLIYSLRPVSLSAGVVGILSGENTHGATSVFVSMSRSFNLAR